MPAAGPDKKLCGAQLPNRPPGRTCRNVAGKNTDHLGVGRCSRHGGNTPSHVASAREQQAIAACRELGVRIELDPGEALLESVWDAAGMCAYYRARVRELDEAPGPPTVVEHMGGARDGEIEWKPPPASVYAPTFHANGRATGRAEPHVLVRLWAEERDRRDRVAKAALDAGVAQRLLDLAEGTARQIASAFVSFALAMGHDPDAEDVRKAMRAALAKAAGAAVDGTATEISA